MQTSRRSSLAGAGKIPGCPLGETMSIKQRFEQEPIYLMDGSAFVYRGFYANQSMQRSDGFPTSALFIVARILMRILREEQPKHFAFVLDGHGPNFRHELFPLYKAQRSATPEDLIKQIDPIHRLIKALGLHLEVSDSCEADDCLASLAKRYREERPVILVATDKDLKQCLHDNVMMWDPASRDEKIVTLKSFEEETGLRPTQWPDVQAIIGDSSDNIPGVKGVGEKTAMALVQRYGSIDDLYAALPDVEMAPGTPAKPGVIKKLTEGEDQARMSYDLATIHTDAPIDFAPENNLRKEPNGPALYQLFLDLEFAKLIDKFHLTAPQGEGAVQEEAAAQVNTASEAVETRERLEELLALWRGLDGVNVLALPSLDVVCVEWAETETEHRAALLFAGKLECYNDALKALFAPEIKKVVHGSKELWKGLLDEGITPGGIVFDTEVAAYLLAPTDGSYDLEKLGITEIDALGKPFDPALHNAVMHVEDENFGENTVAEVFQAGFMLGEKVIRFAMVKVAN